ncbi:hypothetical protein RJB83_11020 [Staphylococcus epidermidis]|nr:hypothetical protein [Staphylococcus epidermidis]
MGVADTWKVLYSSGTQIQARRTQLVARLRNFAIQIKESHVERQYVC